MGYSTLVSLKVEKSEIKIVNMKSKLVFHMNIKLSDPSGQVVSLDLKKT